MTGIEMVAAFSCLAAALGLALYWREHRARLKLAARLSTLSDTLKAQAGFDKLTGLLTRTGFDTLLEKACRKVDQGGSGFCVLYIGLDNFRLLNEAYGHAAGDSLLKDASDRLVASTGTAGKACRVAAGEFAVLVRGGLDVGRQTAAQLMQAFQENFAFDTFHTQLSCSIGIAAYPAHGSRTRLLGNAELAMRSVKGIGGRDFCEFDPKMGVDVREQAKLLNDLRNALAHQEFELYFQPKIDAATLQVTAAEALLRWRHPKRGFVSPVVFIPIAEKYGLIGAIGAWVIDQACLHAAQWRASGLRMRVAVNISGYQMREEDLVDRIQAALERHGLQPGRFTCEITESVAMEDTKMTRQSFERMRALGLHVSIDDFGTGYSSLATLRKLPAEELKIDRAFVMDLEDSEDARLIAKSIIHLAQALNLRVVAEGVETVAQCELLVGMGCNELQGYLFSLPIPAGELEKMATNTHVLKHVEFSQSLFNPTDIGMLTTD